MYNPPPPIKEELVTGFKGPDVYETFAEAHADAPFDLPELFEAELQVSQEVATAYEVGFSNGFDAGKAPNYSHDRVVGKAPELGMGYGEANPKTLMGSLKVRNLSVVPMTALIEEARAMTYGAFESPRKDDTKGYGPFNWRDNDIEYMTYVEAAFRHIMSAADREDIDPETGDHKILHLALARATLGILIDALAHGTVIDNRPTNARGVVASLLREYRKKE